MQITLTLDLTPETLKVLTALCPEAGVKKEIPAEKKPVKKSVVEPEPVQEASKDPEPETPPFEESPEETALTVTKTDVRAAALKLSKAGKKAELSEIFGKFGATKLSEIKEADYAAVMKELSAVG